LLGLTKLKLGLLSITHGLDSPSISFAAKEGGNAYFRKADVYVKPQAGVGIFISYVDAATMVADSGMTIPAECPVYEGTKKIVTQQIRYGVDHDHPYEVYP
jgi:hypothetical protein